MARLRQTRIGSSVAEVPRYQPEGGGAFEVLAEAGRILEERLKPIAREENRRNGQNSVYRDENGKLQISELPLWGGEMAIEHNNAAQAAYLAQSRIDIRKNMSEMREAFKFDPEGFKEWFDGYQATLREDTPGHLRNDISNVVSSEGNAIFSGLQAQAMERSRRSADDSTQAARALAVEDLVSLVQTGMPFDSPEVVAKLSEIQQLTRFRVEAPYIRESEAEGVAFSRDALSSAKGVRFKQEIETIISTGEITDEQRERLTAAIRDPDLDPNTRDGMSKLFDGVTKQIEAKTLVDGLTSGPKDKDDQVENIQALDAVRRLQKEGEAPWADNLSDDQILEQLSDPVVRDQVNRNVRTNNQQILTEAGIPVSDTSEAVLRRYGVDQGIKLLKADPRTPVNDAGPRIKGFKFADGSRPDVKNVSKKTIDLFEQLQGVIGRQLPVRSGFRDADRNAAAGGAKQSQHIQGTALDIDLSGVPLRDRDRIIREASRLGFTGIGVYQNGIHLDTRGGRQAWGPNRVGVSRKGSNVPAWAKLTIQTHMAGGFKKEGSGRTVGDLINDATRESGPQGSNRIVDIRRQIDNHPDAEVRKLAHRDANEWLRRTAEREGVRAEEYSRRITAGEPVTRDQILNDPDLDDGAQRTLLNMIDRADKKNREVIDTFADINDPEVHVDGFDVKTRNRVDQAYKVAIAGEDPMSEAGLRMAGQFITKTGFAPKTTFNALRGAVNSLDPERIVGAMSFAEQAQRQHPNAFKPYGREGAAFSKDIAEFRHELRMGRDPQDAAIAMAERRTPEMVEKRRLRTTDAKKFADTLTSEDLIEAYDEQLPILGLAQDDLTISPEMVDSMMMLFRREAQEQFFEVGDRGAAKARALDEVGRVFAVSTVSGRPRLIPHPPEAYYPTGPDGTHDWLKNQLFGEMENLAGHELDDGEVHLRSDDETQRDIAAGQMPSYQVFYMSDGKLELSEDRWFADPGGIEGLRDRRQQEAEQAQDDLVRARQRVQELQQQGKSMFEAREIVKEEYPDVDLTE